MIATAALTANYCLGAAAFLLGLDALLAGVAAGLRDCGFTLVSLTGVVGWSKVAPSGTIQTSTLFSSAVLVRRQRFPDAQEVAAREAAHVPQSYRHLSKLIISSFFFWFRLWFPFWLALSSGECAAQPLASLFLRSGRGHQRR